MKLRVLGCVLSGLLMCAASAFAQQGTTEVKGKIVDAQSAPVPGATVVAKNQATGMFRETVSGADGTYFVGGLVPGIYEITAELQGFKKQNLRDIRLEIGKTTTLDLELAVGGIEEVVSVSAESPLVDVTTKEVGGNITGGELVDLPSINRNFIGFIGLLPGIVPSISTESFGSDSISVNGADPRSNNYMLDGGNNNDDVIGQRAGTQARTAIESVQEFQVITNQFDAQFGRTTGAIINAVTKSGTNVLHGSAFVFGQDADWTAKDYFAKERNLTKPDTKRREFGGTIGGPIVKDKAHFFFSLERVMIDRGAAIVIPARPDLNWSPTTQDRVWNTMVKFDQQLNANHTWGVRWLRELSPQRNQAITPPLITSTAIREEDDKDQTVLATFSSVFGSTKLNSFRAGWTQEDVAFANPCFNGNGRDMTACEPTLAFQTFTDQQDNTAQARVNDAYQIEDTFSWFLPNKRGDHDVKFGAQYEYVKADNFNQGGMNGTFSFGTSNGPFNASDPRTYPDRLTVRVPGQSAFVEKAHYLSFFAQDKWKMGNRLTATIGVRYDVEKIPVAERNNPKFANEDDYPVDRDNFQPRVGLSYATRRRRAVGRPRRIRPVLRQDPLRDHRRPLQQRRVLGLVYGELPGLGCRSWTAERKLSDRPAPRQRSGAEPSAARSDVPTGSDAPEYRQRHAGRSEPRRSSIGRDFGRIRTSVWRHRLGERRLRARPGPRHVHESTTTTRASGRPPRRRARSSGRIRRSNRSIRSSTSGKRTTTRS